MGYYITGHGQLKVKAEDLDKAYQAMLTLQDRNDLKSGGSWSGGQEIEKWYSWMPADLRTIPSAAEIFRALGFELERSALSLTRETMASPFIPTTARSATSAISLQPLLRIFRGSLTGLGRTASFGSGRSIVVE